jgi:hypothetical protein
MSLQNLLKIRQLDEHTTDAAQVEKMLDTFRVKRNALNYSGEDVDEASVDACIDAAEYLLQHVKAWLTHNKPDLIS